MKDVRMKYITRAEEIILLSIWKLQKNAYGIEILKHVSDSTGKKWSIGAIYAPLTRLLNKGYVKTYEGSPTPERGGRSKIFYELTSDGIAALEEVKKVHEAIWCDVPGFNHAGENVNV